jgi:hypothetical protein
MKKILSLRNYSLSESKRFDTISAMEKFSARIVSVVARTWWRA